MKRNRPKQLLPPPRRCRWRSATTCQPTASWPIWRSTRETVIPICRTYQTCPTYLTQQQRCPRPPPLHSSPRHLLRLQLKPKLLQQTEEPKGRIRIMKWGLYTKTCLSRIVQNFKFWKVFILDLDFRKFIILFFRGRASQENDLDKPQPRARLQSDTFSATRFKNEEFAKINKLEFSVKLQMKLEACEFAEQRGKSRDPNSTMSSSRPYLSTSPIPG